MMLESEEVSVNRWKPSTGCQRTTCILQQPSCWTAAVFVVHAGACEVTRELTMTYKGDGTQQL